MCVIIHKPQGKKLDKRVYKECGTWNKDGIGFAFIEGNEIVMKKGLWNSDQLYDMISPIEDQEMIIHFRRASPGMDVSELMCHPFQFSVNGGIDQFAVVHNGKLPWSNSKEESDTFRFVNQLLKPTFEKDPDFLEDHLKRWMLEAAIGKNNKIAILRYNSEKNIFWVDILNKEAGEEAMGCWFSNNDYRPLCNQSNFGDGYFFDQTSREWKYDPGKAWKHTENFNRPKPYIAPEGYVNSSPAFHKIKGKAKSCELTHLSKPHRKLLKRLAHNHLKEIKMDMTGMDDADKVEWFRMDMMQTFPETTGLESDEMDKWIIAKTIGIDPPVLDKTEDEPDDTGQTPLGLNVVNFPEHN